MPAKNHSSKTTVASVFLPSADAPGVENVGFARILDAVVSGSSVTDKHMTRSYYAGPEVGEKDKRNKHQETPEIIIPIPAAERVDASSRLFSIGIENATYRPIKNPAIAGQGQLVIPVNGNDIVARVMAAFMQTKIGMIFNAVDGVDKGDKAVAAALAATMIMREQGLGVATQETILRAARSAMEINPTR